MDIKQVEIEKIKPYEKNNKKHPQSQIDNVAKSIELYGFVQPLVIDKKNTIVIGHCRYLAAKQLGLTEVPCVYVNNLSAAEVRKLRILDNKLNESDWDFANLEIELAELDFSDFDIDFGVDTPELLDVDLNENTPEVDFEKEKKFECTCPNCGFRFVPIKEMPNE